MKAQIMIAFLGVLMLAVYANGNELVTLHRAVATLKKINPSDSGVVTLTISQTQLEGVFVARLSGVERGEKYIVMYGNEAAPLVSTTLENDLDTNVGLVVPSLDQLRDQPVAVMAVRLGGKPVPYAWGTFTVE